MEINLEVKPLSVNQAWQGRRFKTPKYKGFEHEVLLKLPYAKKQFKGDLRLDITFGFKSTLSDIDNGLKPILDVLQKKYGFDDRQIFELRVKKIIGKEFINIKIIEL